MSLNVEVLEPCVTEYASSFYGSTDRKEQTLWQSEARYRSFFENAVVGLFQATIKGRFLMANPMLARICGYHSPAELTDTAINLKEQLYVERGRHAELLHLLQRQKAVWKFESQVRRFDGSVIWICENVRAICDATGLLIGYEGTLEDITHRVQAEAALQAALQKEKQLKSQLVSMVSHELRSALTVIAAASSLLKLHSQKMTAEARHKYFDKIAESVKNTSDLIEGFLTVSKTEKETVKLKPVPLDLPIFCLEVWQDVQTVTRSNHSLEFADNCCRGTVLADRTLLRQLLLNLLLNAAKYSPEGSPVYLELAGTNSEIILRVKDMGIGIPPEDREHLFEVFHRAQNASTFAGTGLGLAIVKRAVDLHGGKISVDSELGAGTTFTVILPVIGSCIGAPRSGAG
jgi:PAS domain S-box-containing protein